MKCKKNPYLLTITMRLIQIDSEIESEKQTGVIISILFFKFKEN
jgi:hypothetical protein